MGPRDLEDPHVEWERLRQLWICAMPSGSQRLDPADSTVHFGHVDRDDPFERGANLAACFVKSWGGSVFFLILGSIPVGLACLWARPWLPALDHATEEKLVGIAVMGWLGLSAPIAAALTWLRWQRLRHNRISVGPEGLEILWYPRAAALHPWASVCNARYTEADDDRDGELLLEFERGRLRLLAEDWKIGAIRSAVARYIDIRTV